MAREKRRGALDGDFYSAKDDMLILSLLIWHYTSFIDADISLPFAFITIADYDIDISPFAITIA